MRIIEMYAISLFTRGYCSAQTGNKQFDLLVGVPIKNITLLLLVYSHIKIMLLCMSETVICISSVPH